jgi:hypothetical protein
MPPPGVLQAQASAAAFSPPPSSPTAAPPPKDPTLAAVFEDGFDRDKLGDNWRTTSPAWQIEGGRLCGKGAHNHPVWLARTLPLNVRFEFNATTQSADGDLKAEFFGDGASAATGVSYTNATSYLTIFGGWKNTFHVLARIDEHAPGRPQIRVVPDSEDAKERPVVPGQSYHFRVERSDGRTVSWWIGDVLMFKFTDTEPLAGPGHDHFGFNDWEVPVCFDNVRVVPL